jgi:hypothetical protein
MTSSRGPGVASTTSTTWPQQQSCRPTGQDIASLGVSERATLRRDLGVRVRLGVGLLQLGFRSVVCEQPDAVLAHTDVLKIGSLLQPREPVLGNCEGQNRHAPQFARLQPSNKSNFRHRYYR